MPPANKTTWTKESATLLINIVKNVEQKILTKELQVGKENVKTKWDYVADWLHELSDSDATKTSTNCQYKFWELNRHYKFLLKGGAGGKATREDKDGAVYAALQDYYDLFLPLKKKSKRPERGGHEKRTIQMREAGNEGGGTGSEKSHHHMNSQLTPVGLVSSCNEAGDQSGDESGGSPHHFTNLEVLRELVTINQAGAQLEAETGQLVTINQTGAQLEAETGQSTYNHSNGGPLEKSYASSNFSGHEQFGKRKAKEQRNYNLLDTMGDEDSSDQQKQTMDKMARLASYMDWKQTGVGEDWRCEVTDRIEGSQKEEQRNLFHEPRQAQANVGILGPGPGPDGIEEALREDILSYWNELDDKQPTEEECQRYFQKLNAGVVKYQI